MFDDQRGRRVVILAHCILNQNAKLDRCAHCPGAISELLGVLLAEGIGIVQMECPEMLYLGLDRQTDRSARPSVEAEDTRIAQRMQEPPAREIIARIAENTVRQVADYLRNGFVVIGIVGINGSPSCGVDTTWRDDAELAGYGELVVELENQLKLAEIRLPLRGVRSRDVAHAVRTLRELVDETITPIDAGETCTSADLATCCAGQRKH
jgi:predicted secreted protein